MRKRWGIEMRANNNFIIMMLALLLADATDGFVAAFWTLVAVIILVYMAVDAIKFIRKGGSR